MAAAVGWTWEAKPAAAAGTWRLAAPADPLRVAIIFGARGAGSNFVVDIQDNGSSSTTGLVAGSNFAPIILRAEDFGDLVRGAWYYSLSTGGIMVGTGREENVKASSRLSLSDLRKTVGRVCRPRARKLL